MNSALKQLCAILGLLLPAFTQGAVPNIVLIVVDDLGYADLSCTGLANDVHTPNIDRLAARGVRFDSAYATAPICNASRISIMTGAYQQRQGQYWYGGPGLHDPQFTTIAEALKKRGMPPAMSASFIMETVTSRVVVDFP
ncbi:Arylsulfatase [Pontiella desulfatans]|uniref:Arylsulfatase n=1 Tax=Pontiella desulfatans TaxID=2750659 RepID=A0A6C2U5Z7_PONDE|nr:Arylsulfatase [Pontiella desulfatans]